MSKKHYLQLEFGVEEDGSPLIYDFLWEHLPRALEKLGYNRVRMEMERLEPIDRIYSNINRPNEEIKKIFDDFCKNHGLKKEKSLTATREKTSIKASVKVSDLGGVLEDYNLLFDIFFTDLIIIADKKLRIEMMDAASNLVLAIGSKECLEAFRKELESLTKKTKYVDREKREK